VEFIRGLRISTCIFAAGLIYFAIHFFVGQQGLLSWRSYVQRADELVVQRDQLIAHRKELEVRIARLQPHKVDVDYLEERAFSQLGLVAPTDMVVHVPKAELSKQPGAAALPPSAQTPNP
jgi:cell division protein FtsB